MNKQQQYNPNAAVVSSNGHQSSQETFQVGDVYRPYKLFEEGIWIPAWLQVREEVCWPAKGVFGRLAKYEGKSGEAFPSEEQLGEELGLSGRQVRRHIKALLAQRLLRAIPRKGRKSNTYVFLWHEWIFERTHPSSQTESETGFEGSHVSSQSESGGEGPCKFDGTQMSSQVSGDRSHVSSQPGFERTQTSPEVSHGLSESNQDEVSQDAAAAKPAGVQDLGENAVRDREVSASQQQQDTGDLEKVPNAVPAAPPAPVYVLPGDKGHPRFPEWSDDLTTDLPFRDWLEKHYPEEAAAYEAILAVADRVMDVPLPEPPLVVEKSTVSREGVKKAATTGTKAVSEYERVRALAVAAYHEPAVTKAVNAAVGSVGLTGPQLDGWVDAIGAFVADDGKITPEMATKAGQSALEDWNRKHDGNQQTKAPWSYFLTAMRSQVYAAPAGTAAPTPGTEQAQTRRNGGREDERRAERALDGEAAYLAATSTAGWK